MADSYVVVAEIGLTKNSYGAEIRTSEPTTEPGARELLHRVLAGQEPELYSPPPEARIVRIDAIGQYLVVEGHRLRPDRLTRLSIGSVYR